MSDENLELFVPSLPIETEQADLEDELREMKVDFDNIRLRRKGEDNIFAFMTVKDPTSLRFLLKNGMTVHGKKIRVYMNEKRQDVSRP